MNPAFRQIRRSLARPRALGAGDFWPGDPGQVRGMSKRPRADLRPPRHATVLQAGSCRWPGFTSGSKVTLGTPLDRGSVDRTRPFALPDSLPVRKEWVKEQPNRRPSASATRGTRMVGSRPYAKDRDCSRRRILLAAPKGTALWAD
jgi:hypothetical protein